MVELLAKKFIKTDGSMDESLIRQKYGTLCGSVGIFFNIVLFIIKFIAGIISGSVAIVADALNNLSDAGSSIITLVGFKLSGQKPDPDHPFGHGRLEYITGLIVSLFIILMGVELLKSSVAKIFNPQPLFCSSLTVIILSVSIIIKLYMYYYNKKYSDKFNSQALKATAMDSLSDSVATAMVLLATLISQYKGIKIDGYCGLIISALILYTGYSAAKDTIAPLLGTKADKEFVEMIEKFAESYDDVIGVHDLVIHDYGPGRLMITFHAEVPANGNIMELHDTIDLMEHRIREVLGAHAVVHMDPVVTDDERVSRMNRIVQLLAKQIDERITVHDFRMVPGPTHTNLIFDMVLPFEVKMSEEEVKEKLENMIRELPGNHFAVIDVDRPFY